MDGRRRARVAHDNGLYLSRADLEGFEKYAYHGLDTSPISIYIMKPFWNFVVNNMLPMWLSANLMTFVGWLLILSNVLLLWYYDSDFGACEVEMTTGVQVIPTWVWYWCAFAQFLGHQLDGCDGTQARRTKTSSPIGELFDHGLDSSGCYLQLLAMMHSLGICASISMDNMLLPTWAICISFFATHFEKYNTGVLFLPWLYDFSQLMVAVLYLVTGLYGSSTFHLPLPLPAPLSFTGASLLLFVCNASAVSTVLWSVYRIYHSKGCRDRQCNLHTHPPPSWPLEKAILPALPLVYLVALSFLWKALSPSDIFLTDPRLFILAFGTLFSNVTCRLIVSQMCSRPFRPLQLLLLPVPFIVLLGISGAVSELLLLRVLAAGAVLAHTHYGVCVVRELCSFWGIRTFSLSPP